MIPSLEKNRRFPRQVGYKKTQKKVVGGASNTLHLTSQKVFAAAQYPLIRMITRVAMKGPYKRRQSRTVSQVKSCRTLGAGNAAEEASADVKAFRTHDGARRGTMYALYRLKARASQWGSLTRPAGRNYQRCIVPASETLPGAGIK